jgi:hypothetical protein
MFVVKGIRMHTFIQVFVRSAAFDQKVIGRIPLKRG